MKINSEYGSADVKCDLIHGDPRKLNGKEIVMKNDAPKLTYKHSQTGEVLLWGEKDKVSGNLILGKNVGYVDSTGNFVPKELITAFYELEDGTLAEAIKNVKTDIFQIEKWEPIENYTDKYQMESYYQVRPDCGDSIKDHSKLLNIEVNTVELFKLWKKMTTDCIVGRGEWPSSSGYLKKYAYLRPVKVGTDGWSFEIAMFKENKPVTWSEKLDWKPTMLNQGGSVQLKGKNTVTKVEDI